MYAAVSMSSQPTRATSLPTVTPMSARPRWAPIATSSLMQNRPSNLASLHSFLTCSRAGFVRRDAHAFGKAGLADEALVDLLAATLHRADAAPRRQVDDPLAANLDEMLHRGLDAHLVVERDRVDFGVLVGGHHDDRRAADGVPLAVLLNALGTVRGDDAVDRPGVDVVLLRAGRQRLAAPIAIAREDHLVAGVHAQFRQNARHLGIKRCIAVAKPQREHLRLARHQALGHSIGSIPHRACCFQHAFARPTADVPSSLAAQNPRHGRS